MGLENTIQKLDKYFKRLEKGKAQKIKPDHVDRVLRKLETKEQMLRAELEETEKTDKQKRLKSKIALVQQQQERANWLKGKIGSD